jgi:hypothetical protein
VEQPFYIVNAAHQVQTVDIERSIAERDDKGNIIYFTSRFFRDDAMVPRQIARDAQSGDLLISSELAGLMTAARFNGDKKLGFYRAEGRWEEALE